MLLLVAILSAVCFASSITHVKAFGYAPFYRYYNGEHFYTIIIQEIGTALPGQKGKYGYVSEGVQCIVSTEPEAGLVPLYRYWNGKDHFYTTNDKEIGTTMISA